MPRRTGPSVPAIVLVAGLVVLTTSVIGSQWGPEPFIISCFVGSILAGFLITRGR